jgi:hypothetical protein
VRVISRKRAVNNIELRNIARSFSSVAFYFTLVYLCIAANKVEHVTSTDSSICYMTLVVIHRKNNLTFDQECDDA